jgi:predicted nucleic acid-binding protein
MKPYFADTHYYVAVANPRDEFHPAAIEFSRSYRGAVITTEYVLVETGNFMARTGNRPAFAALIRDLRSDPQTFVIPSSTELFQSALRLYVEREDKEWSFTDCSSIRVMREHELRQALTGDHHFEQAGFEIVFKK